VSMKDVADVSTESTPEPTREQGAEKSQDVLNTVEVDGEYPDLRPEGPPRWKETYGVRTMKEALEKLGWQPVGYTFMRKAHGITYRTPYRTFDGSEGLTVKVFYPR
jgi:hypothetical protein